MKNKNKDENKKMSAIGFIRCFEETQNLMESIASSTSSEMKILTEAISPDVDDDGVYDMNNLMDVDVGNNAYEPMLPTAPTDPLNDGDKSAVADEFAKMLMNMSSDVVDLDDIGPMSTVIQTKLGLKSNVEDFINELIQTSIEKQNSQAIAAGVQQVPGMQDVEEVNAPVVDVSMSMDVVPVDGVVAPVDGVVAMGDDTAVDSSAPVDAPLELPVDDVALDVSSDVDSPAAPVDAMPELDAPVDVDPTAVDAPTEDGSVADEVAKEEDHAAKAEQLENFAEEAGNDEAKEVASELKNEESAEADALASEVSEDDSEEEKKVDAKLEAIKNKFASKILMEAKNKEIDAKLEAIVSKCKSTKSLVENEVSPVEAEVETPVAPVLETPVVEPKVDAVVENEVSEDSEMETESEGEDLFESLKAQLESISTEYHEKIEAKEKEVKVDSILESIVTGYHASVNAEKAVDVRLESIAANYKDSATKAKLESVEANKKVKDKLDKLTK